MGVGEFRETDKTGGIHIEGLGKGLHHAKLPGTLRMRIRESAGSRKLEGFTFPPSKLKVQIWESADYGSNRENTRESGQEGEE